MDKPHHPILTKLKRSVDKELERRGMDLLPIVLEAELTDEDEIQAALVRQGPDSIQTAETWEKEETSPEVIARQLVGDLADKLGMD